MQRQLQIGLLICCAVILGSVQSHADIALFLEQPHGQFGAFNPTGHAAVYLSDICAASPTQLRRCGPGEHGVVISRYHRVGGYDWIAIPLIPYLYSVPRLTMAPAYANENMVARLRDEYRRDYLRELIPDGPNGSMPRGDWIQLVGAAYDRKIYVFQITSTQEQDDVLIEKLNSGKNVEHFNLFYRNCSDFARSIFNSYYPGVMRRSFTADVGITTPKQVAKSLVKYSKHRSELRFEASVIPQIPGTPRSKPVHGVLESIVRSKKYVLPLAVFHPAIAGTLAAIYLTDGRFNPDSYAKQLFYLSPERIAQAQPRHVTATVSTEKTTNQASVGLE